MTTKTLYLFLIFLFGWLTLHAGPGEDFPVLYKGRYRPAEAYARLWFYEYAHRQTIKKEDLERFHTADTSPLAFLWSLEFSGNAPYDNSPLFWIGSAELKRLANLPLRTDRFSFFEIQAAAKSPDLTKIIEARDRKLGEDWSALLNSIREFESLKASPSALEEAYRVRLSQLQKQGISPKEISLILEQEYPVAQRLRTAGSLFKSLPSRFKAGEWLALQALALQMYNPSLNSLEPVGNFTPYPDKKFETIREAYLQAKKTPLQSENIARLTAALSDGYASLAGTIFQQAHGKSLSYPTFGQLKSEALYVSFPWIPLLILLYGIAIFLLIGACRFPSPPIKKDLPWGNGISPPLPYRCACNALLYPAAASSF